jgi:enamine deaminase RidA (YjgF/YER057c/UK114 family)
MEKTQTEPGRAQRRIDRDLVSRAGSGASLTLGYLTRAEFAVHQARCKGRLLGAIAFGAERSRVAVPDCPYAWVEMPVLNDESAFEVWTSAQPVVTEEAGDLVAARNEDILFGCLQMKLDCRLDAASYLAYSRIFDFIDRRGYGHLLRVWNYFPQINADADGLERYVRFNVGRHDAFAAKRRVVGTDAPAACALGSRGGDLIIYFLAAKQAGQRVENPRQTSAFHYPAQYGPRSPAFARAMLMQTAGEPLLFVSGTASIVGHETLHVGNAPAQARETVANIQAVMAQAQCAGSDCAGSNADLLLKIYLRDPHDLAMVRDSLGQAFGPAANALYLQADICRADLLLEVEAVYLHASAAMH